MVKRIKEKLNSNAEKLIFFLKRLQIFAAKGPIYHYQYILWRLKKQLQKLENKILFSNGEKLLSALDDQILKNIQHQNENSKVYLTRVYSYLTSHLKTRNQPKFFFGKNDSELIISFISEDEKKKTIRNADEICQNTFRFRNLKPIKFEAEINWNYSPGGNIDWTWDLNRHVYFETLGRAYQYTKDERYAYKFRELLLDWIEKNSNKGDQKNWESVFEVAFRINTWIWGYYYFYHSNVFDKKTCLAFFQGLLKHAYHLDRHLEIHAKNNHLLLEAKSMVMMGVLFPEFKKAKKWRHRGLKIIYNQIREQVCSDGVHAERATHYHRVITGELLELFVLLKNNNFSIPSDIYKKFYRMVEFELWINKPDGSVPLLGDSAIDDTHLRFSSASGGPIFLNRADLKSVLPSPVENIIWLLGHERIKDFLKLPSAASGFESRAFPEGGYFIMRTEHRPNTPFLVFDCGPFGHKPAPNHGHSDALSFEMYAYGQTMLVDPGVYSTHLEENWRNYFRSTHAHNTVVVDDKNQSDLIGTHRVYRPAQVSLIQWFSDKSFDFVDGLHDGYKRLSDPVTHRRQIFFVKPEYWILIDVLNGRAEHLYDQYFHFLPGTKVHINANNGILRTHNHFKSELMVIPLNTDDLQFDIIEGQTSPIQGWVSHFSGEKLPAPVLRYQKKAVAPIQFCTVLYPHYAAGEGKELKISNLAVDLDDKKNNVKNAITGLQIETDAHLDLFVVDRNHKRALKYFKNFMSDGQLVFIRLKKDNKKIENFFMMKGDQLKSNEMDIH